MRAVAMRDFFDMALGLGIVDAGGLEGTQIETPLPYLALACGQQLVCRGRNFSSLLSCGPLLPRRLLLRDFLDFADQFARDRAQIFGLAAARLELPWHLPAQEHLLKSRPVHQHRLENRHVDVFHIRSHPPAAMLSKPGITRVQISERGIG